MWIDKPKIQINKDGSVWYPSGFNTYFYRKIIVKKSLNFNIYRAGFNSKTDCYYEHKIYYFICG